MKHVIFGVILLSLAILTVAGSMVASGKDVRENEMEKSLNTAVEQTMEQLKKEGSYEIGNEKELIADFHQSLLMHISSDSKLEIKILTADTKKGVLDVEVRQKYQTVRGTQKQAVCHKTVLLEQYSEKKEYCKVAFLVQGNPYEIYTIYPGSPIVLPKEPKVEGKVFQGWERVGSKDLITDLNVVEEDLTCRAVFQ